MTKRDVDELQFGVDTEDHLATHGVTMDEVLTVAFGSPRFFRNKVDGRLRMIGRTEEGRLLTIIVQPDNDDGAVYHVVTGWDASKAERTAWQKDK
jgi:hypothetical protein